MGIEIVPGVNVQIIPTKKFKTTQITVRFLTSLTVKKINLRSLLAAIMENSSYAYRTPKEMNEVLANLYGATYGVDVVRRGNVHEIAFTINIINDKFIPHNEGSLLIKAMNFLKEMIMTPALDGHNFDEQIVNRERKHLISNIESLQEDKQSYALRQLQKEYFTNEAQAIPYYGDVEGINMVTLEELYHAYQEMIVNDMISIVVVGDVEQNQILKQIDQFEFVPRNSKKLDYLYQQPQKQEVSEAIEKQNVIQTKLVMGYHTGIYLDSTAYYSLLVFNGLFGGFPHSKLFLNIREKESLAYYASSYIDAYRGMLVVQSGIQKENKDKVTILVQEQLRAIAMGDFSKEDLEQTKTMLINQYQTRQEQPQALKENAVLKYTFPNIEIDNYIKNIEAITTDDVITIAREIALQNIYVLEGSK